MVEIKWYKQSEVKPEDILEHKENPDYGKRQEGYREDDEGRWVHFCVPHQDLHYTTEEVIVSCRGRFEIDIRRKFDSKDRWIWNKWEGAEDDQDLLWCPILPIK